MIIVPGRGDYLHCVKCNEIIAFAYTALLRSIHTCELLGVNYCVNFIVHAFAKNGYTRPLLNFSVDAKVDQIASVNVPTW